MKLATLYLKAVILTPNLFVQNTYLRIVYSSFPLMMVKNGIKTKTWITVEIKTSWKHKRELHLAS
jgi:hypothetical protein